jgi:hypothetical protein
MVKYIIMVKIEQECFVIFSKVIFIMTFPLYLRVACEPDC